MSGSFESVKREAVQLERQLEDKIARFQQVRTRLSALWRWRRREKVFRHIQSSLQMLSNYSNFRSCS